MKQILAAGAAYLGLGTQTNAKAEDPKPRKALAKSTTTDAERAAIRLKAHRDAQAKRLAHAARRPRAGRSGARTSAGGTRCRSARSRRTGTVTSASGSAGRCRRGQSGGSDENRTPSAR